MRNLSFFVLFCSLTTFFACSKTNPNPKVLVFSKTAGWRHDCIPVGLEAIKKLGAENGFAVVATEDSTDLYEENLRNYSAVIFLCTTLNVLGHEQEADLQRFVQAGGGFVGIHSATDTEYDWKWYGELVGGYFNGHPNNPNIRQANLRVLDGTHRSTRGLPTTWSRADEWYNFKNLNPNVHVLIDIDETSYEGGTMQGKHPMAWYHEFDGGRAFYTALGHTKESYSEPLFLNHLLGGIKYAIGKGYLDYSKVKMERAPESHRFIKTTLLENLNEPMQLARFDDGRLIFVERRGAVKLFTPNQEGTKLIAQMNVHNEHEDGLLGIAIDPNYNNNKWIYLFYSPPGTEPVQYVSRFNFEGDSIFNEKIVLKIAVQRTECCHSAGCLRFDNKGNLFISVGDNTNPFASNGYGPMDEQVGRSAWDAQKSSANTNDLRGKVLRIHPENDGTYSIPKGNLFVEGTPNTRPEIYTMGCRNPFRISIDNHTGFLYWGDVGPDAGEPDSTRGPQGHDEVNQARQPGYFGWPFFVGNNKPYRDYDFKAKTSGALYNPEKPINNSPNNTGLQELPAAQKAFIWYPYKSSKEFPLTLTGGRNAMAGPVYYYDDYDSKTKFPKYMNGKLIIYDWMRNWMHLITMDTEGNLTNMEPFAPQIELSHPMDMIFGKDGSLYMLEYGNQWFAKNADARLIRIDYIGEGNRAPIAAMSVDKTVGAAPLTVAFSGKKTQDYDHDELTYEWRINEKTIYGREVTYTFNRADIYNVTLKVTDPSGASSTTKQEIQVGNDAPQVACTIFGNQTFFWENQKVLYNVSVKDLEDGSTDQKTIDPKRVNVSFDYLYGSDKTLIAQGHQTQGAGTPSSRGKALIEKSDCKSCHAEQTAINGPAYAQIAKRYRGDQFAVRALAQKVLKGGSGNWGERAMSAHPQLAEADVNEMLTYILALGNPPPVVSNYPPSGAYTAKLGKEQRGNLVIVASYLDKGKGTLQAQKGETMFILHPSTMQAEDFVFSSKKFDVINQEGITYINDLYNGAFFGYPNIDLTGITKLKFGLVLTEKTTVGGKLEIHTESPSGPLIGAADLATQGTALKITETAIPIQATMGKHNIYFVFKNETVKDKWVALVDWVNFVN